MSVLLMPAGGPPSLDVEAQALATIRAVWPAMQPSRFAIYAAAAVAGLESSWGRGWEGDAAGSHNWGAVHCQEAPPCPPGCVEVDESRPGATYRACLRVYASHEEGARHFVSVLLAKPERRAAIDRGRSAWDVADAMHRSGYYEGACPGEAPGSPACHRAAVARYAEAMRAQSARLARAVGESDPLAELSLWPALGVAAAALGAAWWLSRA